MSHDMKADWDARARENARYYIAVTQWRTEEEFDSSGARDVALFFAGDEELLDRAATVVDLGCGIGRMARYVAPRVSRLIGIDVSGEMVRQARARLAGTENVEFVEGDGNSLAPIASGTIDLVYSHIVFQHLPRPVVLDYFRETWRVLKPGGRFVFQLPEALGAPPPEPRDDDTFTPRYWREAEVRRELESLGFEWEGCRRELVAAAIPPSRHLRPRVRRPSTGAG
jgi:SAM-dependent methyltransferase